MIACPEQFERERIEEERRRIRRQKLLTHWCIALRDVQADACKQQTPSKETLASMTELADTLAESLGFTNTEESDGSP